MQAIRCRGGRRSIAVAVLLAFFASCNSGDCPPPVIAGVAPRVLSSEHGGQITISGRNFCPKVHADFGRSNRLEVYEDFDAWLVSDDERSTRRDLANVRRQDSNTITANVPPGVSLGSYSLQVSNPYGQTVTFDEAATVVERLIGVECTNDDGCFDDPCVTQKSCSDGLCVYDKDADGDGYVDAACGGDDCDDTDPAVFHGSACDDGESCTEGDTCNNRVCAGYPTPACGDCSADCGGICSAQGCCVETCSTGSCPNCAAGCVCDLTCTDGEGCSSICNTGSLCHFVTTGDKFDTDLGCNDATCHLECIDTKKGCNLACSGNAVCEMSCVGVAKDCVTDCADRSSCTMTCDNILKDCRIDVQDGATGLITCNSVDKDCVVNCTVRTDCGGGVWACNRTCP